jgi:hypothetical protein
MNPIQQMTPQEKNIAWMKMLKPLTHTIWFLVVKKCHFASQLKPYGWY